ncbi:ParB family protein [Arthrobacter sp. Sr24]
MSKKKPSSFAPYFTTTDADQVRAAFLATGTVEGYASISELIETATLKEVRRLQRKHNNARPWDGAGPGSLRPGQRTRAEQTIEHPDTT